MPLPDTETTAYSVSFEQVVPADSQCSEEMQFMEAELPTEKGAAGSSLMEFQTQNADDKHQKVLSMCGNSCDNNIQAPDKRAESQSKDNRNDISSRRTLSFGDFSSQLDENANQQVVSPYTVQNDQSWQDSLQLEGECDMGYSSHSACSSCQPGSGSQVDTVLTGTDCFEYAEEDFDANDEMEDLLFHFDKFFRNRYEEILTEQEMHVRQIVKKVIKTCSEKDCFTVSIEVTDKATQTDQLDKFSLPSVISENSLCEVLSRSDNANIQTSLRTPSIQTDPTNRDGTNDKEKLLQRITAFTCDITRLLQRKEYKT